MMQDQNKLQILRHIDKLDRVGPEGVFDRLTTGAKDDSGAFISGVGLEKSTALLLLGFVVTDRPIMARIDLMVKLNAHELPSGGTALDWLLDMPANADNTWKEGGRPANIAWALDDILAYLRKRAAS